MAKDTVKGDGPITIKKYANRRLYNTARSSYVTLDHLAEMVREGVDFVVFDAKSGEDITRSVLTQIIFEEEAKGQNLLPISFLRQLIRLYGDTLEGFVPSYLEASMDAFSKNQEKLREQMRTAFGANPALTNIEQMTRHNMDFFENAMRVWSPFAAAARAAEKGEDARPAGLAGGEAAPVKEPEITALRDQLADMQAQLERISKDR